MPSINIYASPRGAAPLNFFNTPTRKRSRPGSVDFSTSSSSHTKMTASERLRRQRREAGGAASPFGHRSAKRANIFPPSPLSMSKRHASSSSISSSQQSTPGGGPAIYSDRFISSRVDMTRATVTFNLCPGLTGDSLAGDGDGSAAAAAVAAVAANAVETPAVQRQRQEFKSCLARDLMQGQPGKRVLSFQTSASMQASASASSATATGAAGDGDDSHHRQLRCLYMENREQPRGPTNTRTIPAMAERILDAPQLVDDYYLNLLDWSSDNMLAVALGKDVYLWEPATGECTLLAELPQDDHYVSSIKWMQDGSHLAIGTSYNDVQIWDVQARKQVRRMPGHQARVSSLAWNQHLLSSGSRDSSIINHDVRIRQHAISTLSGTHEQEICGLSWAPDGQYLASGGNDNLCCIWDVNAAMDSGRHGEAQPRHTLRQHTAAVKALAWCPFQRDVLATGGGTADRHIRFFNARTGQCLSAVDTKSQVCSLQWSVHNRELVSSHGFTENQITVWKYPSMSKVTELTGHTARVLHTAISADGTTLCSAAADETLRLWRIWGPECLRNKRRDEDKAESESGLLSSGLGTPGTTTKTCLSATKRGKFLDASIR